MDKKQIKTIEFAERRRGFKLFIKICNREDKVIVYNLCESLNNPDIRIIDSSGTAYCKTEEINIICGRYKTVKQRVIELLNKYDNCVVYIDSQAIGLVLSGDLYSMYHDGNKVRIKLSFAIPISKHIPFEKTVSRDKARMCSYHSEIKRD